MLGSLSHAFGVLLRWLRDQQGLGQREVAEAAGISQSKLARLERGAGALAVDDVAPLASALHVGPLELDRAARLLHADPAREDGSAGWPTRAVFAAWNNVSAAQLGLFAVEEAS